MTTIDYQQAAIDAAMPVMRRRDRCPNDSDCLACKAGVGQILAAATPHLRAETVDRLKNFRNDYQHTYAIPGDPYADGYLTACKAIIDLLEGGDVQ